MLLRCTAAMQVVDPHKCSYGVDNAIYAVGQLAQTTMRSELGKITLDKVRKSLGRRAVIDHIRQGASLQACRGAPSTLGTHFRRIARAAPDFTTVAENC